MNLYKSCLRPLLFQLSPELAHALSLCAIDYLPKRCWPVVPDAPREKMGLHFNNPVGLAAGMDKNADHIDAFGRMGFGFIEVGGVTPKPQAGNPKPRVFRLVRERALINRLNLNNKGLDYVARRLAKRQYQGIVGANICKGDATPLAEASRDYRQGIQTLYPLVDYLSINVSCPNSNALTSLQESDRLKQLLNALKTEQAHQHAHYGRYVPLLVKISPDLDVLQLEKMANLFLAFEIDGVIATNTSLSRDGVVQALHAKEAGGLSGAPIAELAQQNLRDLHSYLGDKIPLIGLGGILSKADARARFAAGASLIQLMTGLVYEGPHLIRDCVEAATEGCLSDEC